MRTALGSSALVALVIVAACGGTPEPTTAVGDRDASATPVVTAPPTTPAAAPPSREVAALRKCDASGNEAELKEALDATKKQAAKGPITDRALVDALWACFDASTPRGGSAHAYTVAGALYAVKDASYGAKAIAKLSATSTDLELVQAWQNTCVRLLGELRHGSAARPLVALLLDDKKGDLVYPLRTALAKIAKDAEPILIATLNGSDAELAAVASKSEGQKWVGRVADALAAISRPAGRDAILDLLPKAPNEPARAALAVDLPRFPTSPRSTKAFTDAYAKVPTDTNLTHYGGMNAHSMMAAATPGFFDPSFVDFLLKANVAAKGEAKGEMPTFALPAAIKLMTKANAGAVGAAVNKLPANAEEKQVFKTALAVVQACDKDVACYLKELAKPTPTERTAAARSAHVKAAWMAGVYGDASTRAALVDRLNGLKDRPIRTAILEAVDHLSPTGDVAAADKLEALVASDPDRAPDALSGVDETTNFSLRLRARAL